MFKNLIGLLIVVACLSSCSNIEASNIELIREKYSNKDVYVEFEIPVVGEGIRKYEYGRVANNMFLKYQALSAPESINSRYDPIDEKHLDQSKDTKKSVAKINKIANAMNSMYGYRGKAYDLNLIKNGKIYFVNTTIKEGKWANIGDFDQSKALLLMSLNDTVDGIYYMNVIRDVVTSNKDRVSVQVLNTSKESIYSKMCDCEEVVVQRLSEFGRPIGDKMNCKLYFENGELVYFSPLKYFSGDSPYAEHKNYGIERVYGNAKFKVLKIKNNVDGEYFDLINTCKLERIPLGW